ESARPVEADAYPTMAGYASADGSVPFQRRRGGGRTGLAERAGVDLLPRAVGFGGGPRGVDGVAQRLVVVGQADAVLLDAERLADDLQLARALRGVPLEDRVVGGDRVGALVEQLRHAFRVRLELGDVRVVGQLLVAYPLQRRGAAGRADLLALER